MKKFRFRPAYLVLFGLLCLVAVYFLKGDGDEQAPEDRAAVAGFSLPAADASATRAMQAAPSAPAIVREEQGRLPQIVKEPLFDFQPLVGSDTDTPLDTRLSF